MRKKLARYAPSNKCNDAERLPVVENVNREHRKEGDFDAGAKARNRPGGFGFAGGLIGNHFPEKWSGNHQQADDADETAEKIGMRREACVAGKRKYVRGPGLRFAGHGRRKQHGEVGGPRELWKI